MAQAARGRDLFLSRQSRRTTQTTNTFRTDNPRKPTAYQPNFPPNTGNLIPHKYYPQFRDWYLEMSKLKEKRRPDFESTFHFVHMKPKSKFVKNPKLKKPEGGQ